MNTDDLFTLEWSDSQGCFHIDTMKWVLEKNMDAFCSGRNTDYKLIGLFENAVDAHNTANTLRKWREHEKSR